MGNNGQLATIGRRLVLDGVVNKNNSQPGALSDKAMATTVEAILGAVYMDGGLDVARQVMRTWRILT